MMGDGDDHRLILDLIEKMLEYDPSRRLRLSDAMKHPYFDKLTREQKRGKPRSGDLEVNK